VGPCRVRRLRRSVTPPDYDPTFDNQAIEDAGHLDVACDDVLKLADRRPAEEFAERYLGRRTAPDLLPKIAAATTYLATVLRHPELIQALVDQARAAQSIAERLAEEARKPFGTEIDVPPETV
jgi:hypothetical protein